MAGASLYQMKIIDLLRMSQHRPSPLLYFLAGPIQRMDPLTNLQVAIKNNIDVFYFSCIVPMHVLFIEAGQMGRLHFLA